MIGWIDVFVYLGCFALSLYALSCIRFDNLCRVNKPVKVQLLLIVLSMCTAYCMGQFLLMLSVYH